MGLYHMSHLPEKNGVIFSGKLKSALDLYGLTASSARDTGINI